MVEAHDRDRLVVFAPALDLAGALVRPLSVDLENEQKDPRRRVGAEGNAISIIRCELALAG